jgi:phage protein U
MYALLGDIQFDLITYFDGFECTFAADYAEHAMIAGKPRLQYVGQATDEISIQLAFHHMFCEPETELAKLKDALAAHQALALVLGNGDYKGWFVLTQVQCTATQTDTTGTITALEATLSLREYVGDPANPLPPPAVQPDVPPVQAVAAPVVQAPQAMTEPSLMDRISTAVSTATQVQGALSLASDMASMAERLRDNPLAALQRVPGLLGSLGDVLGPLENLPVALSRIQDQLPSAATVMSTGNSALASLTDALNMLDGASAANVSGKISTVTSLLGSAGDAMSAVSSGVARAAAKLVTRNA